ncbi:HAD family hydrolase [Vibrio sp. 10N.261.46.E12]|uniref:HAD family hydrolase n=1 Tax=unclassified Vibrio TaxID=2614977 RepID=UPI00097748BA|nr:MULTISPECIES: HAD family phosphatase [unclassified Vibrio]OMO37368.1 HAD family hydrolase [Vibrio sp. 10N.261.45.E1]PMJ34259.1 HAD family hydrolase [Vibrio sp. 10N.286.45.B6]PMM72961.1 HAD family hydrolase [Vibrio sp. 10N.261.46.F12]PMM90582.1 HAD family hydrolase [Vibrio sp. 10N.261.46.E8]PMN42800.1 HAD family hydrolase [Vibrio sp. 10N.261.45.E2]
MSSNQIKNVVFDVGYVIVRWSPLEITQLTIGNIADPEARALSIFQSAIWLDLNKGFLTENEAKFRYQQELDLSSLECDRLFYYVKQTQILLHGSVYLIERVKRAGYGVYALTDNVVEIVEHLKATYEFWPLFDGAAVSAELGMLKPQPEIYQALLSNNGLEASETVFIDDMPYNVEGAKAVGMAGIQFIDAVQCENELRVLGVEFT